MKNIIFDWKRTLYDPDSKVLINGCIELLKKLKAKNVPIILVGKGSNDMYEEVNRLEVNGYFSHIYFCKGSKDVSLYKSFIDVENPQLTIFVGDRVKSEIEVGNSLGATTIWVKQGKFASEEPENILQKPNYVVNSLTELIKIIKIL